MLAFREGALGELVSVIPTGEGELRALVQGQATLLEVTRGLAAEMDVDRVLQTAVDGVATLVGFQTSAVYLLEGGDLRLEATAPPLPRGFPDHLRVAKLDDHPHIHEAVRTRDLVFVEDIVQVTLTAAEQAVVSQRNLRTVLYIPLVVDGRAVGAFIVGSVGNVSTPHEIEIGLARTLAGLTAVTMENARLFQEGQTRQIALTRALEERTLAERERQRLEKQLLQTQKLESVGRLAGGVAHDFNNFLTVIFGHVEILLDEADQHGYAEDMREILAAAQRCADLTRQLLAFAKRQPVSAQELELSETIDSMLKLLRRLIGEDIRLCFEARTRAEVCMDPSQIDQILVNLCVNAREAIEGVGSINICVDRIRVHAEQCAEIPDAEPGDYVVVSVADDGCGMDAETLTRAFEPFFTTRGDSRGTGLGLSTVYGIVKQNRGFVQILSEQGVGTTVSINLPLHGQSEVARSEGAKQGAAGGHETVLVVEDDRSVLDLTAKLLRSLGYEVVALRDPHEAAQRAEALLEKVDLLISDVVMPKMDGQTLAARLSEHHPGLRVLFMSGYPDRVADGGNPNELRSRLLPKPFTREQLAAAVRGALD